jgi:hypothetical protein
MCQHILEKLYNNRFHGNPFSGSQVLPCEQMDGQTDIVKLGGICLQTLVENMSKN